MLQFVSESLQLGFQLNLVDFVALAEGFGKDALLEQALLLAELGRR